MTESEKMMKEAFDKFNEDMKYVSSSSQMLKHDSVWILAGFGNDAVKYILKRLPEETNAGWYVVLRKLSGANPVPPEYRGNIPAMRSFWLAWDKMRQRTNE
jgi:hypothetical protein